MNDLKQPDTWKTNQQQELTFCLLNIAIHSNSENAEFMINDKEDNVTEVNFRTLLSRYKIVFETSIKGSDFSIGCVYLLYHKCHKFNYKRDGSYGDSPDWMKAKR